MGVGRGKGEEGERDAPTMTTVFRLSRPLVPDTGLSRVPCGVCPVSITSWLHHNYARPTWTSAWLHHSHTYTYFAVVYTFTSEL